MSNVTTVLSHRKSRAVISVSDDGPKLPEELFGLIIAHLSENSPSLKRCSLVCKSWLHYSSSHLFFCFRWPRCAPDGKKCDKRRLSGQRCFITCLKVLQSSPRLCSFMRELTLARHSCGLLGPQADPLPLDKLVSILALVPRLRTLVLFRCHIPPCMERPPITCTSLPRITTLRIRYTPDDSQVLLDILALFQHVPTLSVMWKPRAPAALPPQLGVAHTRLAVDALCLSGPGWAHSEPVMRMLTGAIDPCRLTSLMMRCTLTPALAALIIPLAANITTLGYRVCESYNPATFARHFRLTHLALAVHPTAGVDHTESYWPILLRDLNVFASADITVICFGITLCWENMRSSKEELLHDMRGCLMSECELVSFANALRQYPSLSGLNFRISCRARWSSSVKIDSKPFVSMFCRAVGKAMAGMHVKHAAFPETVDW